MSGVDFQKSVIIALDVDSAEEARSVVAELGESVAAFKVGLQLFTACGPEFVRELTGDGNRVFLDLKFHDIPNTVAKACIQAARLNVWMLNIHASGGSEMMRVANSAVDEVCNKEGLPRPLLIAVTVLTSSTRETLSETGVASDPDEQVIKLAELAAGCGLDGVVASAQEARSLRGTPQTSDLIIVTPGIRASNATSDDQRRVTTLGEAMAAGSTYAVIGRPVTSRPDRKRALAEMIAEY